MQTLQLKKEDIHQGNLILVNAANPVVSNGKRDKWEYISALEEYSGVLLERGAATVLAHVLEEIDVKSEIALVSGYRTKEEQEQIYMDSLQENGKEFTEKYVALPQHSEHQTGLAIDLALKKDKINFLCPDFPNEGICEAFRRKALQYGFIERYQKEKEAITGIAKEPWHFRYVGYPHSEIIAEHGFSLEEYTNFLTYFSYEGRHLEMQKNGQKIEIFSMPFDAAKESIICLEDGAIPQVSGNNKDGFIITLWREKHEQERNIYRN